MDSTLIVYPVVVDLQGFVTTLKDAFGFIRCLDRDTRMFFHFSELLNQDEPQLQDEVEFTVIQVIIDVNILQPSSPIRPIFWLHGILVIRIAVVKGLKENLASSRYSVRFLLELLSQSAPTTVAECYMSFL